jgi:hypothetical protein
MTATRENLCSACNRSLPTRFIHVGDALFVPYVVRKRADGGIHKIGSCCWGASEWESIHAAHKN